MMIRKLLILLLIISSLVPCAASLQAGNLKQVPLNELIPANQVADSLKWSIDYLNKLLYSRGEWYFTDHSNRRPIHGVLNYAENATLDTVIVDVRRLLSDKKEVYLMDRRPQDIRNVKEINGYISDEEVRNGIENIKVKVLDSLNISNIVVPSGLLEAELSKAPRVPEGEPVGLLGSKMKDLPSEFVANLNKRMATMQFPLDMTGNGRDSVRYELFTSYREQFNDSVINSWRERVTYSYRSKYIAEQSELRIQAYKKAVKEKNLAILTAYNDQAVGATNDSLRIALQYLTLHAEADSALIRLINLSDEKTEFWTANRETKPIRMFLKNAQNDSLSVVLISNRKGELKLVIDDATILTRASESQTREVTFQTKAPDKRLKKVELNKIVYPAWTLIGNGSVGFTQTALSNYWAKGGESSMTLLIMSKYNANYSKGKVRWENSGEFRYGISKTRTRGYEKNDDKIEFQSRFGYSAFKKWFYSAEGNFRTQIARGYKFPDKVPFSAFMAPGYLTMSVGLDYKPNKNFSLFLAPFTSKTTYVVDTVLIKPSRYGLEPGTKKHWEPGIIVKANWRHEIAENITYDTKVEFFNNYRYTFQKFAFEWEQGVIMKVNRLINARVMTQLIYDYNTKFPIKDIAGKEIGRESKWQFRELFTIGLSYKF